MRQGIVGDKQGVMDMELRRLIEEYLHEAKMMQLATVKDGRPWVCKVLFDTKNFPKDSRQEYRVN